MIRACCLSLLLLGLGIGVVSLGQDPLPSPTPIPSFLGGGISYNPSASPRVAGTGFYAVHVTKNSFSFNAVDVMPLNSKLNNTSISTGLAQDTGSWKNVHFLAINSVGVQTDGLNTGWDWNFGLGADVPLKEPWGALIVVRGDKGSATAGAGYRLILGALIRFRK